MLSLLLVETLELMGHVVCASVATEAGAVAAASHLFPDLLIADINLEEGSGASAVQRIIQSGFIPHIFISGDDLTSQTLDPRAVVLTKPFQDHQLAGAVTLALSRRSSGESESS